MSLPKNAFRCLNCAFAAANKEFRQGRRVGRRVRGQPLTFLLKI